MEESTLRIEVWFSVARGRGRSPNHTKDLGGLLPMVRDDIAKEAASYIAKTYESTNMTLRLPEKGMIGPFFRISCAIEFGTLIPWP